MDLAFALFLGYFALPWYFMSLLVLLFLVDVALCESDEFSWATIVLVVGTGLAVWLGGDVNPFAYVWNNLAEVFGFFVLYFAVGAAWSIVKWYFYLIRLRDKVKSGEHRDYTQKGQGLSEAAIKRKRPAKSFAKNNKGRIFGWIGHWPFSMVGTFIGDFIKRIVTNIYLVLQGLFDRMSNHVFAGFDEE